MLNIFSAFKELASEYIHFVLFQAWKHICALVNLRFFFSQLFSLVCARLLFKLVQRSMLAVCAGCGGREEQGLYPFHPQLHRSSGMEEFPATVGLRPCYWRLSELAAPASSACFLTSVSASRSCRFRTEWPQGGAVAQETSSSANAVRSDYFHIALIHWIKCFYVDADDGEWFVFKKVHYQTLKDTREEPWCAVSFKLSGKQM